MRQFGVAHEIFKTLFMSDHDLLIFFNMSEQFLAPGGLNAECVQDLNFKLVSCRHGSTGSKLKKHPRPIKEG